jgi:superfamily II DNA or RNA helicase
VADVQKLPPGVHAGVVVRARGEAWMVVCATTYADCALVTLAGHQASNHGRRVRLLAPFDELIALDAGAARQKPRAPLVSAVLSTAARSAQPDQLWTAVDAHFDLLTWQLAPALSVIRGATRVLLADAVGLGKTVQAGLVLAETLARGWVERALVLTPAGLRDGWADELHRRFGLAVLVLDHDRLRRLRTGLSMTVNPWASAPIVVSSIDLVKRAEIRAAVEDRPLDLLIVDEAHHVTPGTDRGALVERLASRTPWLVLASATPHTGDRHRFRYLLHLGRAGSHDPRMRVFRRSRLDAGISGSRRTHILRVAATPAEARLQASIREYAQAIGRGPHASTPGVRLVSEVVARRATSSTLAVERTLARRLALLSGTATTVEPHQATLPWAEVDDGDAEVPDRWLGLAALPSAQDECAWLSRLLALAGDARPYPSKLACLARFLRRAGEPAIVFTEFRDTLEACEPWIAPAGSVVCLHGGMDIPARSHAIAAFTSGQATFLLATDVAGEGLNLQERCRLVITLEWPWTPQRLEQRVGRVDRIGQRRRVHAVHLTGLDTFEDRVVARVLQRAWRAREDLDNAASPTLGREVEAAVIDGAVHDHAMASASTPPRRTAATPDRMARAETARLEDRRRLVAKLGRASSVSGWSLPSRRHHATRVAVVFEVATVGAADEVGIRTVAAVEVTLARQPSSRREWRLLCRFLAAYPPVRATAASTAPRVTPPVGIVTRLRALIDVACSQRQPRVQGSLFDRRNIRHANVRREAEERLVAHLRQKASRFDADRPAGSVVPRLLAVLPLP